jgi:hypothetical protein
VSSFKDAAAVVGGAVGASVDGEKHGVARVVREERDRVVRKGGELRALV